MKKGGRKLTPRLRKEMRDTRHRFFEAFGRKPGRHDRVLFEQYLYQGREFWKEIRDIAERANLQPMLAFAWQRTGFLITESNNHLFGKDDLQQWRKACKEYRALSKIGVDPFAALIHQDLSSLAAGNEMSRCLSRSIIQIGSFIDKNRSIGSRAVAPFVALYQAARVFNCLKIIRLQLLQRPSRDALALVRTMYECCLRLQLMRIQPETAEALLAQAAVGGEHVEYLVTESGQVKRGRIRDRRTGKIFPANFRFGEIAEVTNTRELYGELYGLLSGVTHAGIEEILFYFSEEDGFFTMAMRIVM